METIDGTGSRQLGSERVTLGHSTSTQTARTTASARLSARLLGKKVRQYRLTEEAKCVLKVVTAFGFIPLLMLIIGVIVEVAIYGSKNAPVWHFPLLCCAGLIAAPFILIRWFWRWPKFYQHMEFVLHLSFTAALLAAAYTSTISSERQYYMAEHIKATFGGGGFDDIQTKDDVFNWLKHTFESVFDNSRQYDDIARALPGQLTLFDRLRLKQSRSEKRTCQSEIKGLPSPMLNSSDCYQVYDEDKQDISNFTHLQFPYLNPSYLNYAGDVIKASDITMKGTLGISYPVAGHWIILPPDSNQDDVLAMLDAMQNASWIDHQTRQISLDFIVLAKDHTIPISAVVIYMVEVTPTGKFLPVSPTLSFNYFEYISDVGFTSDASNKCDKTIRQERFLLPAYLGIVPALIYVFFGHALRIHDNWKTYLKAIYTYPELLWMAIVIMSISFRWRAIYFSHCNDMSYMQPKWPSSELQVVGNYEFLQMARYWELAQQTLAVAVFLQIFNALRFTTMFGQFDTLAATLRNALYELASFSLSFSIVFLAFVLMFHLVFGAEDANYRSISHTVGTLWLGLLGNFEFSDTMWRRKEWSLPLVIFFTFFTIFVLLTVIIAIISDAFAHTKEQRKKLNANRIVVMRKKSTIRNSEDLENAYESETVHRDFEPH